MKIYPFLAGAFYNPWYSNPGPNTRITSFHARAATMKPKGYAESIPGVKARDSRRPHERSSLFDILPVDVVAHIAQFVQHGSEKRAIENALALLRTGGSLTEAAVICFSKWTVGLKPASTYTSNHIGGQESEKGQGLYLSMHNDKELDLLSEIADAMGDNVSQLTLHVSTIMMQRYIRLIGPKLPNVRRVTIAGDLKCKQNMFSRLLSAFGKLDYLELRNCGSSYGWVAPLADHIQWVKKLRIVFSIPHIRYNVPHSLACVWSSVRRNDGLLEEVLISHKQMLSSEFLRENLLQKLPNVRYTIE